MFSLIAFLITFLEVAIVGGSYFMQSGNVLYTALVYGSPFYLLMNLLGSDSAIMDSNPIYLFLMVFHIFKYFIIFRAQISDDRNVLRYLAIFFEALYLVMSSYYIN